MSINELFEIKTEKEFNTEWVRCKRENVTIVQDTRLFSNSIGLYLIFL